MGDPMTEYSNDALQASAHRHLWMHFTRMSGATPGHEIPVITHGEGVWVYDQHGKRYLDGLSGLFTSQLGHGRMELVEAGAEQAAKLAYFPVWSYAHPMAVELADRLAGITPADCNRIFFFRKSTIFCPQANSHSFFSYQLTQNWILVLLWFFGIIRDQ